MWHIPAPDRYMYKEKHVDIFYCFSHYPAITMDSIENVLSQIIIKDLNSCYLHSCKHSSYVF